MAKNKDGGSEAAPATEAQAPAETVADVAAAPMAPPSGMRRLVNVSDAPWVTGKEGNVCYGLLIDRFEMQKQSPRRWYYQIELLAPCTVRVGKADDAEEVVAKKGDIVNLNENFKTQVLRQEVAKIRSGARVTVWAKFINKIKIQGGRTMWDLDIQSQENKPPTSTVRALSGDEIGDVSDVGDDTPF